MEPFLEQILEVRFNIVSDGRELHDNIFLSDSDYSTHFFLLGKIYKGYSCTTFVLPDLNGRVEFKLCQSTENEITSNEGIWLSQSEDNSFATLKAPWVDNTGWFNNDEAEVKVNTFTGTLNSIVSYTGEDLPV